MQTINHVNILGYVGKEAEFYKNQYGTKAILSVATRTNERVQWHLVAFYDKDAEAIALLKRGDEILITGCLEYFKWLDCNGNERIAPEIAVNSFNIVKGQKTNLVQVEQVNQSNGQDQRFDNNDMHHEDIHLNHGQDQHFDNNDMHLEDMHWNDGKDQHFDNNDMHLNDGQDQLFNVKGGYGNHHQTINNFVEIDLNDKFDLEHYQHGGFANRKQY
ncbi:hypothetical protein AMD27_16895 (plasmid) [Acinetobacter sp. TGL-Y2]|uniref:single-stranded DNA-binding protein n=1 Tax=Acinetobacter sp. TGL-Y2 TaxID=1407071 RepID=UPI0007A65893|nr:single-stranded DNA-binding protein [Acinetobacter sp. TGL-Y2]AMW80594.1 hypothetical protein AMD27_16895 [Acinetobacter sp. TGL-Y2]